MNSTRSLQITRPVIFSGPMVRAILEDRKTQTRRIVTPQPPTWATSPKQVGPWCHFEGTDPKGKCDHPKCAHIGSELVAAPAMFTLRCPYGVAGDRLWVRESFVVDHYEYIPHGKMPKERPSFVLDEHIYYRATCEGIPEYEGPIPWRPSIHMPRWASRITLEITKVRVERLQDISEEDAKAEGVQPTPFERGNKSCQIAAFRDLWESLHGKGAWERNDWVWVIEFKRDLCGNVTESASATRAS